MGIDRHAWLSSAFASGPMQAYLAFYVGLLSLMPYLQSVVSLHWLHIINILLGSLESASI